MLEEIGIVKQQALLLHSAEEVEAALDSMAAAITNKLQDSNPLVLCVINGGIIATGKLLPRLDFPLNLDSVHASRYRNATSGSDIHWLFKPTTPLAGRTVLVVDDILDEGHTLHAIVEYCREEGAGAIYTAALFDKDLQITKPIEPDFIGLTVANHYLFGYGMDYKGYLRNAPGVFACKEVL
ncbi:hypoxanthine-guanine phosphoribosyltransferase [Methylomonas fluvii]|uniref:Hypoxanthine-guanine phosphoribosyltransferase n=1 Tax=Methylomonas fluvii TaxID=1854564 RepID=A0ABR9DK86_9GAMM|nr:hypoxanthine-guanine phosphoribosyltransferase [Methylomonas fluvii]MBD9363236.1 hypoxanthine-guanine phosphoribosyltransferase [Methylomonas fluvii]CAD6876491.1 Hypoxanthine-guanine phosphoribosyltransferase (EC 2.4.2.8) [Methylomonas fluvii]